MFLLQLNVWKLQKSCYGQYDESRKWFLAVKEQLLELGMKSLSGDEALFYNVKDGKLLRLCILHVDKKFKFKGLSIQQKDGAIFFDQDDYVKSIEPIANEKVVNQNEKLPLTEYRRLNGQLSWAAENTRPNISYDVRELSTRKKSATYDDLTVANKVLRKA